ncbi:MAG TPA: ankyrin repeat domain-containing protein [Candidatus Babeliales bacterium]|nr:ankyrin repeat domain-containing protein [Candidatus Babeliales bacterium]
MKKFNHLFLSTLLCCSNTLISRETPAIFQEVRAGNKEAIRKRIENCENCAEKDDNGNTPLHIAAQEGQADIVDMLTTEPDYAYWGNWIYSFLYIPTLPDKNGKNNDGNTPLHCALEEGKTDAAECLLQKNVDKNATNRENLTPAFMPVKKDKSEMIPFLEKHRLIEQTINGNTQLHYAIQTNKPRMVEKLAENPALIHKRNNEGKTPAIVATETQYAYMLEILRRKGVDLNIPGYNGLRPIHNAAHQGNNNALLYLLKNGIDVDTTDDKGNTSLFYAAMHNQEKEMNLLLEHGANIKQRNNNGEDIFIFAALSKNSKLINRLKANPVIDINTRDNNGRTSFMLSVINKNHDIMRELMSIGVNTRITNHNNENALHETAKNGDLIGARIILNHDKRMVVDTDKNGNSPLFVAIHCGQSAVAQLFIEHGASLITQDGNTPAHTAVLTESLTALRNAIDYDSRMLLQINKNNETPFLYAAHHGNIQLVDFLLRDNEFINGDFKRAMSIAYANNNYALRIALENKDTQRRSTDKLIPGKGMEHRDFVSKNHQVKDLLRQKGVIVSYIPTVLNRHYSEEELYVMTEAQKKEIAHHYEECVNQEINSNKILLNLLKKEEDERMAAQAVGHLLKQQQQELDRIAAKKRADDEAVARVQAHIRLEQVRAENKRIEEENNRRILAEKNAELKQKQETLVAQQDAELKKYREEKDKLEAFSAQDKALKAHAAAKVLADQERARQQKHNHALEGQFIPADLKASAPPMEMAPNAPQKGKCAACGENTHSKPLPCVQCKKKCADICAKCLKQYKGQCPACWQTIGQFTQKEQGECYINLDKVCTETAGVTPVPSDCCKIGSERICKACLNRCIEENTKNNQSGCCPICKTERKLNEKIIKIILAQK